MLLHTGALLFVEVRGTLALIGHSLFRTVLGVPWM